MKVDVAVRDAYATRVAEYAAALGAVDQMHADDRDQISAWGRRLEGPALDVGCGPGHWTNYLRHQGVDIRGIDPVPEFTAYARSQFPGIEFQTASLGSPGVDAASLTGILCWYSLIHIRRRGMAEALAQINQLLCPGGELMVGFFRHSDTEVFDHAVAPAYRWSVDHLARELAAGGFTVCDIHRRTDPDVRPHACIRAVKSRRS